MRMNTYSQRHSTAVMALLLLVAMASACSTRDETEKANKLVDEGNAALKEARKYVVEAEDKKQKMFQTNIAKLEEGRAIAKEAVAAYDQARDKCKEASRKYEEASKLKVKDKFKEYLTLKAKEFDKRAELIETAKGVPQALINNENHASFVNLANATNAKVDQLTTEANDLAAQAAKLQKANPDSIK
jgi:hypothetical protein